MNEKSMKKVRLSLTAAIVVAAMTINAQTSKNRSSCPDFNHPHGIDLGLPSGTKWACCNVGASLPEGAGGFYAWGETSLKSNYFWETYKWYGGRKKQMSKYVTKSEYGVVDGKSTLDNSDDAATANWGNKWCMPTIEQWNELINSCSSSWTTLKGVNGRKFTGPNGKSIFLPAAGNSERSMSSYWSSSLGCSASDDAQYLYLDEERVKTADHGRRHIGNSVRPVRH